MVLGLRGKNRKGVSVQVDYLIHVQEIKPWPPYQSLKSVQSLLLNWENSGQGSGSLSCDVGDGKVELSESFSLSVALCKESSRKGGSFQKNYLDFHLYESRKEKAMKGQLLGSATVNFADHGIIRENINLRVPINLKKSSRNMAQPILYITIEPLDRDNSSSGNLSRQISTDKDGNESISESMNEENGEEAEIASFTDDEDDDVSSHSSQALSSSTFETARCAPAPVNKDRSGSVKDDMRRVNWEPATTLSVASAYPEENLVTATMEHLNVTSPMLSYEISSDVENPVNNLSSVPKYTERSLTSVQINPIMDTVRSSSLALGNQEITGESGKHVGIAGSIGVHPEKFRSIREDDKNVFRSNQKAQLDAAASIIDIENEEAGNISEVNSHTFGDNIGNKFSNDATRKHVGLRSNTLAVGRKPPGAQGSMAMSDKLKHVKSVQFHTGSARGNGFLADNDLIDKKNGSTVPEYSRNGVKVPAPGAREETTNNLSDNRVELESKLEMFEEELREAAAVEVGLYSVVAEHGSSTNKVHTPARRLSRFYFHVCREKSQVKRANAARASVSGLVLVSKACGNDVTRLAFWLSNAIMLRAIVNQAVGKVQLSAGEKNGAAGNFDEWEEPQAFITALENVEAWIFSRIVESVWWQTMTPHMQPSATNGSSSRKKYGRKNGLGDQEQGNFSIELWKGAFKDACERLCPLRAGGHECGCLPVLAKLVMQQLVGRLDVAMFNAILRESADEMPTDPVSDPITDGKVLPIPASKSSFGSGVQLKNAIGNWSRWLADLFDVDENESGDDTGGECEPPFKAFHLLNALSDLMMLPLEMLADRSTRKEVCPTFSAPLIMRVLDNFVPDEFSPDPIPEAVFEALNSEDVPTAEEESTTTFPCIASRTVYSPPLATSLAGIIGEVEGPTLLRSTSSVLKKSYTSDDELDELDSPINSLVMNNLRVSISSGLSKSLPTGKGARKVLRYQLLREVWRDGE